MSQLNRKWIVQPHGDLVEVDTGILTVEGTIVMPLGKFPRRMTVVALASGGNLIWSAIPLREFETAKVEALGPPRFLIVPNAGHRLDLPAWKTRYPNARVIAPPSARAAVNEAAPVDAQFRQWAGIPGLKRITVSHGDVIVTAPEAALLRAAKDFG